MRLLALAALAAFAGCAHARPERRIEIVVIELQANNGSCITRRFVNGMDCRFIDRNRVGECMYSCFRELKPGIYSDGISDGK